MQEKAAGWCTLLLESLKKLLSQKDAWINTTLGEIKGILEALQSCTDRAQALPSVRSTLLQGALAPLPNLLFQLISISPLSVSYRVDLELEALLTLSSIARNVPTLLKSHYQRLQATVLPLLIRDNDPIREMACQVLSFLPQCSRVKDGQHMGPTVVRVLQALHQTLHLLFRKVDTLAEASWKTF